MRMVILSNVDRNSQRNVNELEQMLGSDDDKVSNKRVKYSDTNQNGTINQDESGQVQNKNFKQLLVHYLDSYVNFVVPWSDSPRKFKPGEDEVVADGPILDWLKEESRSWCPPPMAMIIMSLLEIVCFIANEAMQPDMMKYGHGAVASLFVYDPYKRIECWRFLTCMFVHIGYDHLIVNLITQVFLGVPLERKTQWWRVLAVLFAGVVAGSLTTSIVEPVTYLAGASGGAYAIITAHISNIIMNWKKENATKSFIQLVIILLVIAFDVGIVIYNINYPDSDQNIGYAAHCGGALAGLLVGIWVLKLVKPTKIKKYLWWSAFVLYIVLMSIAILLNILWTGHFVKLA